MLVGTSLTEACIIANTPQQYIDSINHLLSLEFTTQEIEKRKKLIASMNNEEKTKKLIALFNESEDNTQYFNDEWNNYRQLSCKCNLPRPNSFTGNCTSCNKIIKPIRDKNVDKHTR